MVRKQYLSLFLAATILGCGLFIGTNTNALRWIYKLFAARVVLVGEVPVQLHRDFFVLSKKGDTSLLLIGGFYTDAKLLPTDNFLTVVKYDHLREDSLERLRGACQKQNCDKFEVKDISGVRCAIVEGSSGFGKLTQPLNVYCPFEKSKLMIEYHGTRHYQAFFQAFMTRLIQAGTETENNAKF